MQDKSVSPHRLPLLVVLESNIFALMPKELIGFGKPPKDQRCIYSKIKERRETFKWPICLHLKANNLSCYAQHPFAYCLNLGIFHAFQPRSLLPHICCSSLKSCHIVLYNNIPLMMVSIA